MWRDRNHNTQASRATRSKTKCNQSVFVKQSLEIKTVWLRCSVFSWLPNTYSKQIGTLPVQLKFPSGVRNQWEDLLATPVRLPKTQSQATEHWDMTLSWMNFPELPVECEQFQNGLNFWLSYFVKMQLRTKDPMYTPCTVSTLMFQSMQTYFCCCTQWGIELR